jgi:putative hemolysin
MEGFFLSILILANGIFAMTELAVVSSRKSKLRQRSEAGDAGAKAAYELANSPSAFLSTIQVVITLVGILTGALGSAVLSEPIAEQLRVWGVPSLLAEPISLALVVLVITVASVIFGELLPKRLALAHSEAIASRLARPTQVIAGAFGPVVRFLSWSTDTLAGLFGVRPTEDTPPVSHEEIRQLVEQGQRAGVFTSTEQGMLDRVLRFDELRVEELMTPSVRITWINADEKPEVIWRTLVASGHSYFPVYRGSRENILGVVSVKALWANMAAGLPADPADLATPAVILPETIPAMRALEQLQKTRQRIALVSDEFGNITGILSLLDLLEAVVGELPSAEDRQRMRVVRREDGSWLVDATLPIEDFVREVGKSGEPFQKDGDFQTLGGFVVHRLARIPKEGDHIEHRGFRYEVVDMDRHRLDKVLVSQLKG